MSLLEPTPRSAARAGFLSGCREALGAPAAVMSAGFIGYGSMANDAGIPFWLTALATVIIWALPGQIILAQMYAVKASAMAIILAVMMSAMRFLPTGMALMPLIQFDKHSLIKKLLVSQFIAMTSWALAMREFPLMPARQRGPWLAGFGVVCTFFGIILSAVGYLLAGAVPPAIRLGLVFLPPIYFTLLMFGDIRSMRMGMSVVCGSLMAPLVYSLSPDWSVLMGGVGGGSLAYWSLRLFKKKTS